MNLPGPNSPSVRAVIDGAARHYDLTLTFADYEQISDMLADAPRNFFTVRALGAYGPDRVLFAVRLTLEDQGFDGFVAVLRSKSSRIPVDVLPADVLEPHMDTLRYFTRIGQNHFGLVREKMIEHFGYSFFTLEDYTHLTETVRTGRATLVGENSFELLYRHPKDRTTVRMFVAFDPDSAYITDVLRLAPVQRSQNRFERGAA